MSGHELACAVQSYLGASFRLHGRDPITGFDCLGLVMVALRDIGRSVSLSVPYGLRNLDPVRLLALPASAGLVEVMEPELAEGDVLVLEVGPAQLHVAVVALGGGIIHAHAGLRRVVRTPFPLPWPLVGQWRLK